MLAVAAAAVLAGCRSVLAVAEWAAEAPQPVLREFGARRDARTGSWQAPSEDTFRRLLARVDAVAVDRAIGVFLAERTHRGNRSGGKGHGEQALTAVAVDGKTRPASWPSSASRRAGPTADGWLVELEVPT